MQLYDSLGGEAALQKAVGIFYQKVMSDPEISPYFDGVDMQVQRQKMYAFMNQAFGGEYEHTSHDLRVSHARLKLTDSAVDKIITHLDQTLIALNVEKALREEVVAIIELSRPHVLGRS